MYCPCLQCQNNSCENHSRIVLSLPVSIRNSNSSSCSLGNSYAFLLAGTRAKIVERRFVPLKHPIMRQSRRRVNIPATSPRVPSPRARSPLAMSERSFGNAMASFAQSTSSRRTPSKRAGSTSQAKSGSPSRRSGRSGGYVDNSYQPPTPSVAAFNPPYDPPNTSPRQAYNSELAEYEPNQIDDFVRRIR
jgi:hypothetical protein